MISQLVQDTKNLKFLYCSALFQMMTIDRVELEPPSATKMKRKQPAERSKRNASEKLMVHAGQWNDATPTKKETVANGRKVDWPLGN